ncbi:hypothetical protein PAXINDRAFT_14433 [Paxillus involutus ATCC 200175]|uniref:Uncharacterized protein n=1 Tax=Paxillus involutus ATCC 200175 TaxID=664439 RepID=A0A0C9TAT4_PAXIN|nr:hypothetical protein PAXINDRAFT_14433 [Paxillus involutus ATCC 200175]
MAGPVTNNDAKNSKLVSQLLDQLKEVANSLPTTLPDGTKDGPIAIHLSNLSVDEEKGPFYSFNWAWELVFQRTDAEKRKLIVRGKYGLKMDHSFTTHFVKLKGIEANGNIVLIAEHLKTLLQLITEVTGTRASGEAVQTKQVSSTQSSGSAPTGLKLILKRPRPNDNSNVDDVEDKDYVPPKRSPACSECGSNESDASAEEIQDSKGKGKANPEDSSLSEDEIEEVSRKGGHNSKKAKWALEQFTPRPATSSTGNKLQRANLEMGL